MVLCPPVPARLAVILALAGAGWLVSLPARAQMPADMRAEASSEASAQQHFDRALEQYRAGQYGRALASLEQAAKLDPNGKDLFFNLALVHEKLGQLSQAITALERFRELETDVDERERARLTIERLRGAADELPRRAAPAPVPCPEPVALPAPAATRGPSPVMIGAASVAIVSLVIGAVFGVKALSDEVGDASTSASFSVAQLRERGRRAEREALIADVAFGLAAASAGTFACLWVMSPSETGVRAAGINLRGDF